MRLSAGYIPELSHEEKRRQMVARVTGEIVENLLLTGSDNPIVLEVKNRLNTAFGEELFFRYPPGELDIILLRQTEQNGEEELAAEEKERAMNLLWRIAEEVVNETML